MTEDVKSRLREAQIELLREKTKSAKAGREMAELRTFQAQREEKFHLLGDDYWHEHYFVGPVDGPNVDKATTHLSAWHRLDPTCDMNILIHSGGGSALAGINLFDQLTAYSTRGGGNHNLTVTVRGLAASMASVLVQAADWRVIGPRSRFMIHELSASTGGKIGEMEDAMDFYRQLNSDIGDLYVARSEGKIDREQFDKLWTRKDTWLTAQQALDYGFVDEIG